MYPSLPFRLGDSFVTLESDIGHHIIDYHEKMFKQDTTLEEDYSVMANFAWNMVSDEQNLLLTSSPSDEEIREAVFDLDPASGPSPRGFGGYFYHCGWEIISHDVSRAISHLFNSNDLPRGINSNFVELIPKVANSIRVTDFCPIVMGNFVYKVYTKIVATRLGNFIGDILSPS